MQSTFIIGEQRSGSNLLRVILNCHSQIHAPHPPHIIERIEPHINKYGDLTNDDNFHILINHVLFLIEKNPISWEFIPTHKAVFEHCSERSLFEIFKIIMELCARHHGAQQWICKSNHIVKWSSQIEKSIKTPKYIYLYRDPRDVVLSFQKTPVGDKHPYVIAKKWSNIQKECLALSDSYPNRVLHVAYENLIAKPHEVVHAICNHLGISFEERMLNYFDDKEAQSTAGKSQQWENINKPILLNNHGKYAELPPDELRMIETECQTTMTSLGYTDIHSDSLHPYSNEEMITFNSLNEQYKKEFSASMSAAEIELRLEQKKFLEIIEKGITV